MYGTWHYTIKHPEVVTNSLDLISFVLVTPELLKKAEPVISRALRTLIRLLVGAAFIYTFYIVFVHIGSFFSNSLWGEVVYAVLDNFLGFVVVLATLLLTLGVILAGLSDTLVTHLFAVGVVLFISARIIGLLAALYAGS